MSFSGGVYTLPGPALVTGEVVSATENNQFRNDVAGAFNLTFLRNGTSTATANLPMGGFKLTGLGAPTTNGDALSYGNAAVVTSLTSTALTATRVPYAGTGGLLQDASTFTFDGTTLTAGGFSTSGNIAAATATVSGNITVSGGTANGVAYLNGSKVLTTGSALTFDGTALSIDSTSNNQIALNCQSGSTGTRITFSRAGVAKAYFGDANSIIGSNLDATALITTGTNPLIFGIGSEQMRLTSTGLGIGTSSPYTKFDVASGSTAQPTLGSPTAYAAAFRNGVGGGGYGLGVSVQSSGNSWLQAQRFDGTATAYDMVLQPLGGNLGLGVTPSAWSQYKSVIQGVGYALEGYTAVGENQTEYLCNAYFNSGYIYRADGYASKYWQRNGTHSWHTAHSGTAGNAISFTQAMTLDASGNLGVGTTSPSNKLVVSNGGAEGFEVLPAFNAGETRIASYNRSGAAYNVLSFNAASYIWYESSVEKMRIDSSGNVGIGTSTPNANTKLDVAGPTRSGGYTVSTLPTGVVGARAYVTDAVTAVFMAVPTGGGSVKTPVFYNGSNWVCG